MKKQNPELDSLGLSLWPLSFKNDAYCLVAFNSKVLTVSFPKCRVKALGYGHSQNKGPRMRRYS
jgi:hypothetical protein